MARKFFTADWHLSSRIVNKVYARPFADVHEMNEKLIENCNSIALADDIVIHLGDFLIYGENGAEEPGLKISPSYFIDKINATFVNIEGNHDPTNKTKSIGWFMETHLGSVFDDVSMAHWPSYNSKIRDFMKPGWIHLCGHVHDKWKHYIDRERQVLNINVGVDVWGYRPVSETELISYIKNLMPENIA